MAQEKENKKKLRGFISYSHKDENLFKVIKEWFENWYNNDIDFWTDKKIEVGKKWHEEILSAMKDSDFSILLLSPDFFNSTYIKEVELKSFLEMNEISNYQFFPIEIRKIDETIKSSLSSYQSFRPDRLLADLVNTDGKPTENVTISEIDLYFAELRKKFNEFLEKIIVGSVGTVFPARPAENNFNPDIPSYLGCFLIDSYYPRNKCLIKIIEGCIHHNQGGCKFDCPEWNYLLNERNKFIKDFFNEIYQNYFKDKSYISLIPMENPNGVIIGIQSSNQKMPAGLNALHIGILFLGFAFKLLKAVSDKENFENYIIKTLNETIIKDTEFENHSVKVGFHYGTIGSLASDINALPDGDLSTVSFIANIALKNQILFSHSFLEAISFPPLFPNSKPKYFATIKPDWLNETFKKFGLINDFFYADSEVVNIREMPRVFDNNNSELIVYSTYISSSNNPNIAICGNVDEIPERINIHMRSSTPLESVSAESNDSPLENDSFREFIEQIGNYKEIISIGITHENWLYFFIKALEKKYYSECPKIIYDFEDRIIEKLKNGSDIKEFYHKKETFYKINKNTNQEKKREINEILNGINYNHYHDIISMLHYDFPWEKFIVVFLDKSLFPFFREGRKLNDRIKGANKGESLLRIIFNKVNQLNPGSEKICSLLSLTSNLPFVGPKFSKPHDKNHPKELLGISLMVPQIETWDTPKFRLNNNTSNLFIKYDSFFKIIEKTKNTTTEKPKNTDSDSPDPLKFLESFEEMHLLGDFNGDNFIPKGYAYRSEKNKVIEKNHTFYRPIVLVVFYLEMDGEIRPVLQVRTSVNSSETDVSFSNLSGNVEYMDLINLERKKRVEESLGFTESDENKKQIFWLKNHKELLYGVEEENCFYGFNEDCFDKENITKMWENAAKREIEEEFGIIIENNKSIKLKPLEGLIDIDENVLELNSNSNKKFLEIKKGNQNLLFKIFTCKITEKILATINQEREWANVFWVSIADLKAHFDKIENNNNKYCNLEEQFREKLVKQITDYKGEEAIKNISKKNIKQKDKDYFKNVNKYHEDILSIELGINNLLRDKFEIFENQIWKKL
jgi:hypothetical protein